MATSTTASESRMGSTDRMAANVWRAPMPLHGLRRPSALLRLSQRWGCSEKTAKLRLYGAQGIFAQAADVVEVFCELGEIERLAGITARYEAALVGAVPQDWQEILVEYGRADGHEDVVRAGIRTTDVRDLSDEQLAQHRKALAHEILRANQLLAKLEEDERRRRES